MTCLCSVPEYLTSDGDDLLFVIEVRGHLVLTRGAPVPFVSPSIVCPRHSALAGGRS